MRYAVIAIAIVCCLLGGESSDTEWDKHRFISRKNLGFTLCLKEFYKDLPNEIVNARKDLSNLLQPISIAIYHNLNILNFILRIGIL